MYRIIALAVSALVLIGLGLHQAKLVYIPVEIKRRKKR